MINHEYIPGSENLDAEYSGPHSGDERDPKTLAELMPIIGTEILHRVQNAELLAARNRVIEITNHIATNPTSVTEEVIKEAKMALLLQEARESARNLTRRSD